MARSASRVAPPISACPPTPMRSMCRPSWACGCTWRRRGRVEFGAVKITEAAGILARGGLVAFPTETVYGLGADATNPRAIARVYEAKGRPRFNPLIAHVP